MTEQGLVWTSIATLKGWDGGGFEPLSTVYRQRHTCLLWHGGSSRWTSLPQTQDGNEDASICI